MLRQLPLLLHVPGSHHTKSTLHRNLRLWPCCMQALSTIIRLMPLDAGYMPFALMSYRII
jgi:hypothetical protein